MTLNCIDCSNPFDRPDRGKGSQGRRPLRCNECRRKKRNQESADYRYRERQQFMAMREDFRLLALADANGQLAEWLAPVDLQASAQRYSAEGISSWPLHGAVLQY